MSCVGTNYRRRLSPYDSSRRECECRDTVWQPSRCQITILRPLCSVVLNHITSQKWCQNFDLRSIRLSNRPHFYSFLAGVFRICLLATPRPLNFKISSDEKKIWRGRCIKNSCVYALCLSEFLFLTPDINIQGSRNRENSVRPERSVRVVSLHLS
jgi:hypothetical protein